MGFTLLTLVITKMAYPAPGYGTMVTGTGVGRQRSQQPLDGCTGAARGTSTTASMCWMRSLLSFPSLHISQLLDQVTHLTELNLCICLQRLICHDLEGHFSRHSLHVQPGKWQSPYPDNTGLDSPCNKPSLWSRR